MQAQDGKGDVLLVHGDSISLTKVVVEEGDCIRVSMNGSFFLIHGLISIRELTKHNIHHKTACLLCMGGISEGRPIGWFSSKLPFRV